MRVPRQEAQLPGLDAKSKKVRILPKGEQKAKAIYERYCRVCLEVLNRPPVGLHERADSVRRFNEEIMQVL